VYLSRDSFVSRNRVCFHREKGECCKERPEVDAMRAWALVVGIWVSPFVCKVIADGGGNIVGTGLEQQQEVEEQETYSPTVLSELRKGY
jgi:hypothetical protein